jgi:hypothetical protein
MTSFRAIIDRFGYRDLAAALGRPPSTVSAWRSRDRIPSQYWAAMIDAAERRGLPGITYRSCAVIDARSKGSLPTGLEDAAGSSATGPFDDAGAVGRAWARVLALVANANGDGPGPPEAATSAAAGVTPPSG